MASGLARSGQLGSYVTSMTESIGGSLGLATRAPGFLGAKARAVLSRRPLPGGVSGKDVVHRGMPFDFGAAALIRLTPSRLSRRVAFPAHAAFSWRMDRAMARLVSDRNGAVIGSWGSCARTFERARDLGIPRWLQYPIAHHQYAARLLAQEAELQPEFADTLQFESLPRRLRLRLEREIELADRIFVYCSFHRESFLGAGVPSEKLVEIPLGVDLELFEPTDRSEDGVFRVTFVGQIGQRKGLSYLLDGFGQARIPNSELALIGRPIGSDLTWRNRARVRHEPHQPRSALPELYGRTDVFVLPSLVEGFGLTALEAMSCGRPVIVSEHTFGQDLVEDGVNGFVVPIRDAGAIAERLELLSAQPAERARMGMAARRTAQRYSWEVFGDRVAAALSSPTFSESAPSSPRA